MAISRAGRWAIATDGTFSLGYLTWQKIRSRERVPYRLIKSRWLVGTDDLFTVETIHSSAPSLKILDFFSKFWILIRPTQVQISKNITP